MRSGAPKLPGIAAIFAAAALLLGCAIGPRGVVEGPFGPVIDGWPIGEEEDCSADPQCDAFIEAATAALDHRDLGHAAVVSVALHDGGPGMPVSTFPKTVVVFALADESQRAIAVVQFFSGPLETYDFGPGSIEPCKAPCPTEAPTALA